MSSGGKLVITLPWPSADLSPNARLHWAKLGAAKRKAREDAFWLTRSAMGAQLGPTVTSLSHDDKSDVLLRQIAHAPDARSRDRDNLDSRLKAARDGISQAVQINDRFFRPLGIEWGEPVRGGKVVVEIELPGEAA